MRKAATGYEPKTSATHSTKHSSHRFSSHFAESQEATRGLDRTETSERHTSSSESRPKSHIEHGLDRISSGEASGWPDTPNTAHTPTLPPRNQCGRTCTSRVCYVWKWKSYAHRSKIASLLVKSYRTSHIYPHFILCLLSSKLSLSVP